MSQIKPKATPFYVPQFTIRDYSSFYLAGEWTEPIACHWWPCHGVIMVLSWNPFNLNNHNKQVGYVLRMDV